MNHALFAIRLINVNITIPNALLTILVSKAFGIFSTPSGNGQDQGFGLLQSSDRFGALVQLKSGTSSAFYLPYPTFKIVFISGEKYNAKEDLSQFWLRLTLLVCKNIINITRSSLFIKNIRFLVLVGFWASLEESSSLLPESAKSILC